jgi:hypothetical protein
MVWLGEEGFKGMLMEEGGEGGRCVFIFPKTSCIYNRLAFVNTIA